MFKADTLPDLDLVRDHSKPCEHGHLWPHYHTGFSSLGWGSDCPGGKKVELAGDAEKP